MVVIGVKLNEIVSGFRSYGDLGKGVVFIFIILMVIFLVVNDFDLIIIIVCSVINFFD